MSVNKEKLDSIAKNYHQSKDVPDKFIEDIQQEYSWMLMKDYVEKSKNILELGFGEGIITSQLINSKSNLTILEGSSILAKEAKDRFKNKNLNIVETLFEEYKPEQTYDLILANHVLEHVDEPKSLLLKMSSWLNPKGKIFAIVPNADSLHRRLGVHMNLQKNSNELSPRDHSVGHLRVYNYEELEKDFTDSGYKIVESGGYFFKIFSNGMMIDFEPDIIKGFISMSKEFPKELLANLFIVAETD